MTRMLVKNFLLPLMLLGITSAAYSEETTNLGYEKLSTPQPVEDPTKVEVIEFFWYGCPHCYSFEPFLHKWEESLPDHVNFIRQPAIFSALWAKHAKAYFTAEALGIVDKVHADFFDAIQNKKQKLETEDQLAKFFVAHGVDEAKFHDAYNSFMVDTKMRQAKMMGPQYRITGVPSIIINGKYLVSGRLAGSHKKMIEVMNKLIEQEKIQLSKK